MPGTSITARWAGPADATTGSGYWVEWSLDGTAWETLAADQAATSPYISPSNTLADDTTRGATVVSLTSATGFSSTGYGYVDDALIQWTGKIENSLTGVTWHSGYGTYAGGSTVCEAHEAATETFVSIPNNAVLFRITHLAASGIASPSAYLWHFLPPTSPANCCTVVTVLNTDLGFEPPTVRSVDVYLALDTAFALIGGAHLDRGSSAQRLQIPNPLGLTFHSCWRSSARESVSGANVPYVFVLDSSGLEPLTVTVDTIPDLPWVLLSQIATGAS